MRPVVWMTQSLSSVLLTTTLVLAPCFHEDVDSMIFVHVKDMAQRGKTKALTRTVDTDVVVILAVANFL